jgi:hypothetical protein
MPRQVALRVTSGKAPRPLRITRGPPSSRDGPNFPVLVVHGVVAAKLAPRKSHGFVLSEKRSHRLAARAHDTPSFRQ